MTLEGADGAPERLDELKTLELDGSTTRMSVRAAVQVRRQSDKVRWRTVQGYPIKRMLTVV